MNNIIIDGIQQDIDNSITNFHSIGLHVAQLNLEDYNQRFDTDFDLIYYKNDEGKYFFKISNPPQYPLDHKIDSEINFFRSWAVNYDDKTWFRNYYNNIESLEYNDIMVWRPIDNDMYSSKAQSFKKRYTDYAPLGFLSEEEIQTVKSEISNRFLRFL